MDGIWSLGLFLIPIVAIAGGILAGIVATVSRGRVRELEIRERIAMIERGMVPPPESDPETFDRRMHSIQQIQREHVAPRHRSAGVVLIAIGLGMMVSSDVRGRRAASGPGHRRLPRHPRPRFLREQPVCAPPTLPPRSNEPPVPPTSGS